MALSPANAYDGSTSYLSVFLISMVFVTVAESTDDRALFQKADAYMNTKYVIVRDKVYSHNIHFTRLG